MSRLLRWVAPLVALADLVSPVHAQVSGQGGSENTPGSGVPYLVGIALMIVVMVIVCMPSRKQLRVSKDDN